MCRLLGYIGAPIQLENLLYKPEHSLIVQSYQPKEMTAGLLNADGFGIGWHHANKIDLPYTYKNVLPIWSDLNLPQIARYIETKCMVGYVRSATPGLPVDLINCQPFTNNNLLFIHNGYIANFRQTLYRPIRNLLNDFSYQSIQGNTDSEHIWALIITYLQSNPESSVEIALNHALSELTELAYLRHTDFSANIIISTGDRIVASRYSNRDHNPTLYWLKDDPLYPNAVMIASEPMFRGNWNNCPENSIITVGKNLEICINPVSSRGDRSCLN